MTQSEDETARRENDSGEQSVPGEEPFHLARATEEELKRLAAHPVEEAHRLQGEARDGNWGTGLFLLLAEVGIGLWLLAGLLILAVFLVAYFLPAREASPGISRHGNVAVP